MEKMDSILGQVAAAGYQGVQSFVDMVTQARSAERFAKLLAKHHLHTAGIYATGPIHDAKTAQGFVTKLADAVKHARGFLDLRSLTFSPDSLPDRSPKSDDQLDTQADALKALSVLLSEHSVRLLYHPSVEDFADNAREFRQTLRRVPNRTMGLCFDADNVLRGGQVPGDMLDMFVPRVQETHMRTSKDGVWDEQVGDGDVMLQELVEQLDDYDFKGWHIVELSREPQTPRNLSMPESLKRSHHYIQTMQAASNRATRWHYRHT